MSIVGMPRVRGEEKTPQTNDLLALFIKPMISPFEILKNNTGSAYL